MIYLEFLFIAGMEGPQNDIILILIFGINKQKTAVFRLEWLRTDFWWSVKGKHGETSSCVPMPGSEWVISLLAAYRHVWICFSNAVLMFAFGDRFLFFSKRLILARAKQISGAFTFSFVGFGPYGNVDSTNSQLAHQLSPESDAPTYYLPVLLEIIETLGRCWLWQIRAITSMTARCPLMMTREKHRGRPINHHGMFFSST